MQEPENNYDPRTRRQVQGVGPVYENRTAVKDQGEMNRQKILFRELVNSSVYKSLKALAYTKCYKSTLVPVDVNSEIQWRFHAIRRGFVDELFNDIERLGKIAPEPEDIPVQTDGTRMSFFAEN